MKFFAIVCVFSVVCCVRESDSFKILKNVIHPTESTTAILPSLPEYKKKSQYHQEEDSKSWEHEFSTSKIITKHSEEDVPTSQASEQDGDSFTNSKNKPNKVNHETIKFNAGASFRQNLFTTTTSNYDNVYGSINQFSSSNNINNQESRNTNKYDQRYNNENYPGQSSFSDNHGNQYVKSTTPSIYGFTNQNKHKQFFEGHENHRTQNSSTTPENYVSLGTLVSLGLATTPRNPQGLQDKNPEGELLYSYSNLKSRSTTPRNDDGSYGTDYLSQSSPFDSQKPQKTVTKNKTENGLDQSFSFNNFNNALTSTTPIYENTIYNEIQPGEPTGNKYDEESFVSKSTTSRTTGNNSESSIQGGDQHSPGSLPPYSPSEGLNKTKPIDDNGEVIVFPDHPSLNPTPEPERTFDKEVHKFKDEKKSHSVVPVPVDGDGGRRIIDGPLKDCGPGRILDQQKGVCKELARK